MNHENYKIEVEEWLTDEASLALEPHRTRRFIGDRPYRHFDARVPLRELQSNEAEKLLNELRLPSKLSIHKFYPFVRADKKIRRYTSSPVMENSKRVRKIQIKQKVRPIMYASHSDAVLFGFYGYQLKKLYDDELKSRGLDQTIIAYRKIPRLDSSGRNKSNIDFANDIFTELASMKNAAIMCLDVSDFFGSMTHTSLKKRWNQLLGTANLPQGHDTIFRNITRFRYIFLNDAQVKVGLGSIIKGKFYFKDALASKRKTGPITQSAAEYNSKIKKSGLIKFNGSPRGIPQGSPISDILANLYLIDFDTSVQSLISTYSHGVYRRYSDDILLVCPQDKISELYTEVQRSLEAEQLRINNSKSELFFIDRENNVLEDRTSLIVPGYLNNKSAVQYLGFEFDLHDIHVRSGTIANHYRKLKRRIRREQKEDDKKDESKANKKSIKKDKYAYLKRASKRIGRDRLDRQFDTVRRRTSRLRREHRIKQN